MDLARPPSKHPHSFAKTFAQDTVQPAFSGHWKHRRACSLNSLTQANCGHCGLTGDP